MSTREIDLAAQQLRQAVVFAALLEYFTQLFTSPAAPGVGKSLADLELDPEQPLRGGVKPLPNPARVREYWADVLPPGTPPRDYPAHWCGGLCLFAIRRAELARDVFWKAGFAARVLRQLEPSELPQPGDVAYFTRNQHHAIVTNVNALTRTFDSVDGNQSPGILRHWNRKLSSAAAFYSLEPLLMATEASRGT